MRRNTARIGACTSLIISLMSAAARADVASPVDANAGLRVVHAYLRSRAASDTGTVHAFLHNISAVPIEIKAVGVGPLDSADKPTIDQLVAEADSGDAAEAPLLWWLVRPNPVPPGGFSDVAAKLSQRPDRKVRLKIVSSVSPALPVDFARINDGLSLTYIGFSPRLDTVYLYVENRLDVSVTMQRVRINARDVTGRSRFLWTEVAPKRKTCVVVPLEQPLEPGAIVLAGAQANHELACCAELVRAFSMFPINWLDGSLPVGLADTPDQLMEYRPGYVPAEGARGIENIMRCPAHAHGTRRNAAVRYIRRYGDLMRTEPQVPGMMYVCRWEKEVNYFTFAELGDFVRIMPFAESVCYESDPLNHRVQWLTALGVRAAAPRPAHAVVPIRFADSYQWKRSCTSEEIRAMVYLPVSRAAKGICYGAKQPGLSDEAAAALEQVTREILQLRPYLQFADYLPLGRTDKEDVEAACLLAGDQAVILLVINHSMGDFDNDKQLVCQPRRDVTSVIELPPGLGVTAVTDVMEGRPANWQQSRAHLRVRTAELAVVRPYLIQLEQQAVGPRPPREGGAP
ncbi:MAG TPA: hypothetical protein VMZ31_05160 [Phycisphaerae bacterium]|nr:hypothetical protein [Phycisphaerae bacterium]